MLRQKTDSAASVKLSRPHIWDNHSQIRASRDRLETSEEILDGVTPGVAIQGWEVDMKRKAHESNIPPTPAPRIKFMILSLSGWKDWGLDLGFLGLSLGNAFKTKRHISYA